MKPFAVVEAWGWFRDHSTILSVHATLELAVKAAKRRQFRRKDDSIASPAMVIRRADPSEGFDGCKGLVAHRKDLERSSIYKVVWNGEPLT